MELLGGGLRSTEAETREVEQFFQSMFGMMHETDLFPAEPQDGAYEVVSVSTIQAQMENLLCASCVFLAWLYCADFLSIPVWSHSWCCWWPHHKHLLQTSKHLWLIGEYLSDTVLFFLSSLSSIRCIWWKCWRETPFWSLSSDILHTHAQRTSNDAGVLMSSAVLVVCRHMVVVFPFLPAFAIKGTVF